MKKEKVLILIIVLIGIMFLAGCKSNQLIGGQKDEHNCLIAAGYSWCEAKQKCLRTWEEKCTTETSCTCPENYVQEGNICNPKCYYNIPPCLMPSIECSKQENSTELANPASVYCEDNDGTIEIVNETAGQRGICTLKTGEKCDEWAYFRGECGQTNKTKTYCTPEQIAAEACTMEYAPVCGNDNVTYGNKCSACASKNIEYWTEGECQK